jgi:hypothetical protein
MTVYRLLDPFHTIFRHSVQTSFDDHSAFWAVRCGASSPWVKRPQLAITSVHCLGSECGFTSSSRTVLHVVLICGKNFTALHVRLHLQWGERKESVGCIKMYEDRLVICVSTGLFLLQAAKYIRRPVR